MTVRTYFLQAATHICKIGEKVLNYAENEKKGVDSLVLVNIKSRMIAMQTSEGNGRRTFNLFQIES